MDNPGVRFPPPLVPILGLALGWGIDRVLPAPIVSAAYYTTLRTIGIVLGLSAFGLAGSAFATFRSAGTSPIPIRPASVLVARGPYRFTRNPMYVSLVIMAVGFGLIGNSWWQVASAVPAALILNFAVISREERYLARKFGEPYAQYQASVRRWL